jgi:hypothetical protein
MKKLFFVLTMGAFLASCKKEYTCICSVNGTQYSTSTIKDTKKKAEEACNRDDGTITFSGIQVVIECSI